MWILLQIERMKSTGRKRRPQLKKGFVSKCPSFSTDSILFGLFFFFFCLKGRIIDILLKETDTKSTLTLIGTCAEIDDDEKAPKSTKEKGKSKDSGTQTEPKVKEKKDSSDCALISHKYDLNEKWSQTIDFPRKKKGTQSEVVQTKDTGSQVVSKDLLF